MDVGKKEISLLWDSGKIIKSVARLFNRKAGPVSGYQGKHFLSGISSWVCPDTSLPSKGRLSGAFCFAKKCITFLSLTEFFLYNLVGGTNEGAIF